MELVAKRKAVLEEKKESVPELKELTAKEEALRKTMYNSASNKELKDLREKQRVLNQQLQETQKNSATTVEPAK